MKKIYYLMLLMAALICLPWSAKAEQLNEGFENITFPPEGWSTIHVSGSESWQRTTSTYSNYGYETPSAAYLKYASAGHENYLVTPVLRPSASENLTFYIKKQYSGSTTVKVELSTTTAEASAFTVTLATYGDADVTSTWAQKVVEIPTEYVGTDIYLAFHIQDAYGFGVYLDQVAGVTLKPEACPKPEELTVSNVEATSATVSWTTEAATSILEYKLTSETDWTVVSNATSPYNLTGLTSSSDYDVRVKIDCGTDGESRYAESSFNTPCGAKAIPFNSDFTSIDCWTMENCHESTGLSGDAFRFHWTSNYPQYLISPELVASEKKVVVSFEYKVESESNPESFAVGYSTTTNDLTSFTWGEETANCVNTSYVEYSETLPENVKYVAIKCTSNDKYYLYIDNFSVDVAPSCIAPVEFSVAATPDGAVAKWTGDEDTQYQWCVVAKDAEATGWALLEANVFTKTVSGLTAGDYDFYVRQYCSESDQSAVVKATFTPACTAPANVKTTALEAHTATIAWDAVAGISRYQYACVAKDAEPDWTGVEPKEGLSAELTGLTAATAYDFYVRSYFSESVQSEAAKFSFTTACDTYTLPFEVEGFDHNGALPNCWDNSEYTGTQWTMTSYDYYKSASYSARYNARTAAANSADLKTPAINLTEKAVLTFYYKNNSSVTAEVLVYDGEKTDTVLAAIPATSGSATVMTAQATVDLSDYAGKTVNIIFRGHGKSSSTSASLYIDDVAINYLPVAAPTELAVEAGDKQATISWTNIEEDATYNLRHKATAAEEWTTVNGVTNPYVLGDLTNNTEYEVQVQAVASEHRVSEWTESATFTPVACASIETVTFGDKTYNSVVVNWTATAAGKWDVRYQAEGDADYTDAGTNLTDQTITLNDLKTNVAYTIEVKAACSEAWTAAETLTLHYSSPANITASNIEDVTATLSWDAVADAPDGYKYIVVARGADVDWTNAEATDALTAELSGLSGLTDYDFYVAALYGENLGTPVKAEFATIAYAPKNLTAGEITTTTAAFTWAANGAATRYQWSTDGENWSAAQEELTATATGLKAATTYTFYVRSYYAEGKYSEPVTQDFTTACDTYTLPFEENFENAGLPNCWESEDWSESVAAGKWSIDNSYSHSGFTALRFNANTANSASISTPEIALGQKAELSFFLRNVYGDNDGYVGGKVIAADVENEENKVEAEFIQSNAENLSEQKLDLSELLGKTVKITFEATGVSAKASLYIDDVKVTVKPDDDPTAIGNTSAVKQVIKTIENDQMVIIIDGVKYNAQGQKL